MDVLQPDPLRLDARDVVVRERTAPTRILALVMSAVALGWTVVPWILGGSEPWLAGLLSAVFGLPLCLIALVLVSGALRGLRGDAWTVRVGQGSIWLRPRSYLGETKGREPGAWLRIGVGELRSVRPGEQTAHVPDGEGGLRRLTDRWLDLELSGPAPAAARAAVDLERAPRRGVRFHAYPLEWRGERTLRVYWRTAGVELAPERERVLDALPRSLRDAEGEPGTAPVEDVEALARQLHARGRVLDAIRLLRERRGWSLSHARNWLREAA